MGRGSAFGDFGVKDRRETFGIQLLTKELSRRDQDKGQMILRVYSSYILRIKLPFFFQLLLPLQTHDEEADRRKEREQAVAAGGVDNLVVMPRALELRQKWLVTNVAKAEYLPIMDSGLVARGGDFFFEVLLVVRRAVLTCLSSVRLSVLSVSRVFLLCVWYMLSFPSDSWIPLSPLCCFGVIFFFSDMTPVDVRICFFTDFVRPQKFVYVARQFAHKVARCTCYMLVSLLKTDYNGDHGKDSRFLYSCGYGRCV